MSSEEKEKSRGLYVVLGLLLLPLYVVSVGPFLRQRRGRRPHAPREGGRMGHRASVSRPAGVGRADVRPGRVPGGRARDRAGRRPTLRFEELIGSFERIAHGEG